VAIGEPCRLRIGVGKLGWAQTWRPALGGAQCDDWRGVAGEQFACQCFDSVRARGAVVCVQVDESGNEVRQFTRNDEHGAAAEARDRVERLTPEGERIL